MRMGDPTKSISGTRTEHPVPMNKMRQRIAERLKDAQNTAAMLTTFNECDMRLFNGLMLLDYLRPDGQIIKLY